jgi:uncharacterized zinc-type alcohol dehydrogenase-like protein
VWLGLKSLQIPHCFGWCSFKRPIKNINNIKIKENMKVEKNSMDKLIQRTSTGFSVKGYGAKGASSDKNTLKEMDVERANLKADEVLIEVLYCGVCHSDIHQVNNDWDNTNYPCVPGHEIIGKIVEPGSAVKKFKIGQIVGVGCMIDSCQTCTPCKNGDEQFCAGEHGPTMTYNGYFRDPASNYNTFGGFSTHIAANEAFLLNIPEKLDLSSAAPILCAGVTTYAPMKHWGVKKGDTVAIVGIGGLGHMGVQIAKAMGAKVTAITTHESKKEDAKALGADDVLVSTDKDAMAKNALRYDYILITIPTVFDVNHYLDLLTYRGSLITVGLLGEYEKPTNNMHVAMFNRTLGGSIIGSISETQEILNFCAKHEIAPEVEMISIDQVNKAFENIKNEEVRFRYVIDMNK